MIEFLLKRQSNPNLTEPAPNKNELEQILQAAMTVPDHGGLTPYRFIVVEASARSLLADIYKQSAKNNSGDDVKIAKAEKMPFRSPMMIIVTTNYQEHPKVPKQEQLITAGCAAYAMEMAAVALGYQAMWRTGDMAYCNQVKQALSIDVTQDIVGYLYLGTESKSLSAKPRKSFETVTRYLT